MRGYLSHSAMILLGVTLAVGFYEGRRLVKNTARALGASPTVAAAGGRRGDDDHHQRVAVADEANGPRRALKAERGEGPRRRGRTGVAEPGAVRGGRVLRDRRVRVLDGGLDARARPVMGGMEAPGVAVDPAAGEPVEPAELPDTGAPLNP